MPEAPDRAAPARRGSDWIAPDCRGLNFFAADRGLQDLLRLHRPEDLRAHLWPHLDRLSAPGGGRLDEIAAVAVRREPVLHARDRYGRDEDWIEYHPA